MKIHSPLRTYMYLLVQALLLIGCDQHEGANPKQAFHGEIKVGILHSRSGTMAVSEGTAAEGEALAIEELNAKGGLNIHGKRYKIVPVDEDGASDPNIFAEKAKKLIDVEKVSVVFGGWTSASRKAMLPIFEQRNHLLFYPIQYEGQECSRNVFYGGATPNQQIEPAIEWLMKNKGSEFFLVGSDYVFPRTAHRIIKGQLASLGGTVKGEDYIPLGTMTVGPIIEKIKKALPNGGIIINTLNGDSNLAFFKGMQSAYLTPTNGYSIMSFSIAEEEASAIGPEFLAGTYATWDFFQSLDTRSSRNFTKAFKNRFGDRRVTSDPTEAGYNMVNLWAEGVHKAQSLDIDKVNDALIGVSIEAPEGLIQIQPNHHLKKRVLIGEIQEDGMFKILENKGHIDPETWNRYIPETNEMKCDWRKTKAVKTQ